MNKTLTFYWMQQFTWKRFYDDLHTFVLLVFHERDLLCARMITGILEPFGHYLILRHPFCHFVTKHCLFSLPSPLNFLWSAALSPALCSTGSKLLFLVQKPDTCEQESSLFVLPINVHHLWQMPFCFPNELKCCVQSKFLVCYYCVLCEWQQVRCTEKTPWQKSLALCV